MTATATSVVTLTRKFKLGATMLDDPAPHLPPEEALKLFIPNYPFLASARLGEPVVEGTELLVFPVEKPQVQTKGAIRSAKIKRKLRVKPSRPARATKKPARTAVDDAIDALERWGSAPAAAPASNERWAGIAKVAENAINRDPAPIRDAFLIPLA